MQLRGRSMWRPGVRAERRPRGTVSSSRLLRVHAPRDLGRDRRALPRLQRLRPGLTARASTTCAAAEADPGLQTAARFTTFLLGIDEIDKSAIQRQGGASKSLKSWWTARGSNSRPPDCEPGALPAELAARRREKNRIRPPPRRSTLGAGVVCVTRRGVLAPKLATKEAFLSRELRSLVLAVAASAVMAVQAHARPVNVDRTVYVSPVAGNPVASGARLLAALADITKIG